MDVTPPLRLRLRRRLSRYFVVAVVLLVLVVALAGYATYDTHATTEYDTERTVVAAMNESTSFEHSARVVNDSRVWSEGDVAENRPRYYLRLMPELDGTYHYRYDVNGSADGDLTARTEVTLYLRGIEDDGEGDQEILWETRRPLASATTQSLSPGETHTGTFTLDVRNLTSEIGRIQAELGDPTNNVRVLVRATTDVEGTVDGQDVSERHGSRLPVVVRDSTYWTEQPETVNESTVLDTRVDRTPLQPPPVWRYGAPAALAASILALVGLVGAFVTGRLQLSEREQELCALYDQRTRFDEWISQGDVPSIDQYHSVVKVSSLAGLVDLAIDTNNRVIEDDTGYYVLRGGEDVAYVYAPKISPLHDWLYRSNEFGGISAAPESLWPTAGGDDSDPAEVVEFDDFSQEMSDGGFAPDDVAVDDHDEQTDE